MMICLGFRMVLYIPLTYVALMLSMELTVSCRLEP